jgi:hypothetical protein
MGHTLPDRVPIRAFLPTSVRMEHMSAVVKNDRARVSRRRLAQWWPRLAAAMTGAVLTLVVPVHAWAAANGTADLATEAAKLRRRRGGFGILPLFGGVCCLFVVAVVVLGIVLVSRRRRK